MPDSTTPIKVNIFASGEGRGTTALVRFFPSDPGSDAMANLARNDDAAASCFAWSEGGRLCARCYSDDYAIEFCGHGLLSTAAVAERLGALGDHPATGAPTLLDSGTGRYHILRDKRRVWLASPRIPSAPYDFEPDGWFDTPPSEAARTEAENGYWIFRWPDGFDLAALRPDFAKMARETGRGVIATARDAGGWEENRVSMRYFAPRYGTDEDQVTGSAAVVLGDFWREPRLQVHQRSAAGGCIQVAVDGDAVAITGNIHFDIPRQGHRSSRDLH